MDIFYFEKSVKKGNSKDLSKLKRKKIWIDISNVTRQQAETLQRKFNLHSVTEEDLVVTHERIKVEQFPNYLFCTFYGIGKKGGKIELVALNYIIGKKFIITTHRGTIDTYERLKRDKEELKDLFNIGIDAIFHRLLDEEIDNFFPVLEEIDDEIERIDEKIAIKTRPEVLSDILNVKKN